MSTKTLVEPYSLIALSPLSGRERTVDMFLRDPHLSAVTAQGQNALAAAFMAEPGMARAIPAEILAVGSDLENPRLRTGGINPKYDGLGYPTGAAALDQEARDRVGQHGPKGVVRFDAAKLAALTDGGNAESVAAFRQDIGDRIRVTELLNSKEREVHHRVLAEADAGVVTLSTIVEGLSNPVLHAPLGETEPRQGYVYGAIGEEKKTPGDVGVMMSLKGGGNLTRAGLVCDGPISITSRAMEDVTARLSPDAHLIVINSKSFGADVRTLVVGMPAARVGKVVVANSDAEFTFGHGRDAAGQPAVLQTISLEPRVSVHGGHELPKAQPMLNITHDLLEVGRPASVADVAAISSEPQGATSVQRLASRMKAGM